MRAAEQGVGRLDMARVAIQLTFAALMCMSLASHASFSPRCPAAVAPEDIGAAMSAAASVIANRVSLEPIESGYSCALGREHRYVSVATPYAAIRDRVKQRHVIECFSAPEGWRCAPPSGYLQIFAGGIVHSFSQSATLDAVTALGIGNFIFSGCFEADVRTRAPKFRVQPIPIRSVRTNSTGYAVTIGSSTYGLIPIGDPEATCRFKVQSLPK
jgi:hypothetical protein